MKGKYDHADREEAEEAYGDYMDVVDAVKDALADMRDRFARRSRATPSRSTRGFNRAFEARPRRRAIGDGSRSRTTP